MAGGGGGKERRGAQREIQKEEALQARFIKLETFTPDQCTLQVFKM